MDLQRPGFADVSGNLLSNLLREREVRPKCALLAQQGMDLLAGGAVIIYLLEDQDQPHWVARATVGEVHLDDASVPFDSGTLGFLAAQR